MSGSPCWHGFCMISRVRELLVIEDGPRIRLEDRPAQGTRHEVLFGVMPDTAEPVVVKLERVPGALERERTALAWLTAERGPVPRLLLAGTATIGDERAACLVTERRPGSPPATTDGWRRMGRAYARLSDFRHPADRLMTLDPIMFGRCHAQRVSDLGGRLAPVAASVPDWERLVSPEVPGSPLLVITHGDPGPGNFLDDGDEGTIIDWEEAHIAPRGLDLARLVFIALLGAGPSGYVAREHRERASAALDGYLGALRDRWRPSREESRWWTTVAGVQFIHRRWERRGRPASWEDAADVLRGALAEDLVWSSG